MHLFIFVCVYVCMCAYMYVCIYLIFKLDFERYGGIVLVLGNCPGRNIRSPPETTWLPTDAYRGEYRALTEPKGVTIEDE